MNQLFETTPSGKHTKTWPFPDNSTGLSETAVTDSAGKESLPARKWGERSTRNGFENAVTFRIKHSGYFISVFAKTSADYTLVAYTHYGPINPTQKFHDGAHRVRRNSLKESWLAGQLMVSWSVLGSPAQDTFQLFMTQHPKLDGEIKQGHCGQQTDPSYWIRSNNATYSSTYTSECILWTPCGLERNGERVGDPIPATRAISGNGDRRLSVYVPTTTCFMRDVERADEKGLVFTGDDGARQIWPAMYGNDCSEKWDQGKIPLCADNAGTPIVGRPDWCDANWCYVDIAKCDKTPTKTALFPQAGEVYWSAETCTSGVQSTSCACIGNGMIKGKGMLEEASYFLRRTCALKMNTDYHFSVLRIPADGSEKEVYQAIETNWSYHREHVYASGNAVQVDGGLLIATVLTLLLLSCKIRSKRKIDMKLNAVFKEAMIEEQKWVATAQN